jgi:nicotianamine synthase
MIHNIDRDASALTVSCALTEKLGHSDRMTFACEDATDASGGQTDWDALDVVFLAALVGMQSSEKVGVLRGLRQRLRVGTLVVCRSARGMRGVLYPVSNCDLYAKKVANEAAGAGTFGGAAEYWV